MAGTERVCASPKAAAEAASPRAWLAKRREARRLLGPGAARAAFAAPPAWYVPSGGGGGGGGGAGAEGGCPRPGCGGYVLTPARWLLAQRLPRPPARPKRVFMQLGLRQGYRCAACRELLHPDSQADHVVPWSLSADDRDANIQLLCPNCHAAKSGAEAGRIRLARAKLAGAGPGRGVCWACLEEVVPRCLAEVGASGGRAKRAPKDVPH
jgi:hypothetical protein